MADGVFRTKSVGAVCEGQKDQYADGKAARVWEVFIGDKDSRTHHYNKFLVDLLKRKGCRKILDVACGTGVDSVMLLQHGFKVTSIDASDKMLKYALKKRWHKRKEDAFDKWVIEEANWLTLASDIDHLLDGGFDAVICLGNSFAHLMDISGDQVEQRQALRNFERCVRPGGLLLIDHRNFDFILDTGTTPNNCIYYNSPHTTDIKTSVLYVSGKPSIVTMDYFIDISNAMTDKVSEDQEYQIKQLKQEDLNTGSSEFRLSYYPHRLEAFTDMLAEAFPSGSNHTIYGDFKSLDEIETPAFYIHLIEKPN